MLATVGCGEVSFSLVKIGMDVGAREACCEGGILLVGLSQVYLENGDANFAMMLAGEA